MILNDKFSLLSVVGLIMVTLGSSSYYVCCHILFIRVLKIYKKAFGIGTLNFKY